MSERLWFRSKRYGWGWTPVTWQGWLVLAIYVAAFTGWLVRYMVSGSHAGHAPPLGWLLVFWPDLVPLLMMTAALIAVCWIKGERPHWRWGK